MKKTIKILLSASLVLSSILPYSVFAAIAIDSSSPVRVTSSNTTGCNTGSGNATVTTASFNPPANSVILLMIDSDKGNDAAALPFGITNSGTALNWTQIVKEEAATDAGAFAGGYVGAFYATTTNALTNLTVTVTNNVNNADSTCKFSLKVYVVTGANVSNTSSPIGATKKGSATTQTLNTTAYTSTKNNSRGFGAGTDDNALGTPTSSDTGDGFTISGSISGISVYKAADTATAGSSVSLNMVAAATGPGWNWVSFEIIPSTVSTPVVNTPPKLKIINGLIRIIAGILKISQ